MPELSRAESLRACERCSRAKVKCAWLSTRHGSEPYTCQRCLDGGFTCVKSPSVPKRKRGAATHAKVLERKLDDIMALLTQDREQSACRPAGHDAHPPNAFTPSTTTASHELTETTPLSGRPHNDVITVIPGFEIPLEEVDLVLQKYTTDMLPQFPFVPLPICTAYDLWKDKPLLLKTILWTYRPPGPDISAAFERWFRQHIAHRTVVLGEKSLEVLQSILVFLAWKDPRFYANASETSLLQLAVGIAGDLGLTKSPEITGPAYGSIVEDAAHLKNDVQARGQHTGADRRAVLGVFYITSILSTLFGKPFRLEYAPYFDECCRQLLQEQVHPTDLLLVYLVRICRMAIKVHDTFWQKSDLAGDKQFWTIHAMAIATIEKELDKFTAELPESLKSNHLLRSHCVATRVRLFEPAIHTSMSDSFGPHHSQSRILWDYFKNSYMLLDVFILIPVETYTMLSFVSMFHLLLGVLKSFRFLCGDHDNWDVETARRSFDFNAILQQLSERFDAASRVAGPRGSIPIDGRPFLETYAERLGWIKSWYLSKQATGVADLNSTLMEPVSSQGGDIDLEFWQQLLDSTYGPNL